MIIDTGRSGNGCIKGNFLLVYAQIDFGVYIKFYVTCYINFIIVTVNRAEVKVF